MIKNADMENIFGKMEPFIKGSLKTIKDTELGWLMRRAKSQKESGRMGNKRNCLTKMEKQGI